MKRSSLIISLLLLVSAVLFNYSWPDHPRRFASDRNHESQDNSQVSVVVDAGQVTGTIRPVWNGIGGPLGLSLTPEGDRLLKRISEASPYPFYKRCWGITESGMSVPYSAEEDYGATDIYRVDKTGKTYYDFTVFDQIMDNVLSSKKFIPIMLLGSMPDSLSSAPLDTEDGRENIEKYPPKDYNKWYNLVYYIVNHSVRRYGKAEVARWKWEVWNEPDITEYWRGTEAEYFKLYDYAASAVKDALPEAQVGGNSVTQSQTRGTPFLDRFVRHCMNGTNFRTGRTGSALDFITFHLKGTNFAIGKIGSFDFGERPPADQRFSPSLKFVMQCTGNNLKSIAGIPGTSGIPVYVTECDIDIGLVTSMYENPNVEYRNTAYFPAFQCAMTKELLDISDRYPSNPVENVASDAFYFPGFRIFEGQRTLFTAGEIEKPILNAYRLLGKLGLQRLQFDTRNDRYIDGLATLKGDSIQVMIYNFNEEVDDRESADIRLTITLPDSQPYRVTHYRIDEHHSNAYTAWQESGRPLTPDEDQMKKIKSRQGLELFGPAETVKPVNHTIELSFVMPHHSVSLITFEPLQ